MRRFLRLLVIWLIALALPVQGAMAATVMATHAPAAPHATMTMPDGTTMDASAMPDPAPCHGHAIDKAGCGACCGPVAAQQAMLVVAPVADRWAALPRSAADAAASPFLTGGTDRPPRALLG